MNAQVPENTQALPAGTRIEEFVIERVLGSGGFGITYLARDVRLNRQVVIKENLPVQFAFRDPNSLTVAPRHSQGEDAENFRWSLENFSKEAAMLASLDHPGIVKVHRSFQAFGTAYFVMPFIEGTSLEDWARARDGQPLSEEWGRNLLGKVLLALSYLHEQGLFHRDIKPGNLLITSGDLPVLIDFGSARHVASESPMTLIECSGYSPFEQLQSRGNVGPWTDLYALGATMVKLLTGVPPPSAHDRIIEDPCQPLVAHPHLARLYSRAFLSGIDRALEVPIDRRWQSALQWEEVLSDGGETSPAPTEKLLPDHHNDSSPDPELAATDDQTLHRGRELRSSIQTILICLLVVGLLIVVIKITGKGVESSEEKVEVLLLEEKQRTQQALEEAQAKAQEAESRVLEAERERQRIESARREQERLEKEALAKREKEISQLKEKIAQIGQDGQPPKPPLPKKGLGIFYRVDGLRAGDTLNIRKGPGVDHSIIAQVYNGQRLEATGKAVRKGSDYWVPCKGSHLIQNSQSGRATLQTFDGWANMYFVTRVYD